MTGDIYSVPQGDVDVYSFVANPGDRVYAATMTSKSSSGTDSVIELLNTDGVTLIESDDNDGFLSASASVLAGAIIPAGNPAGSTYYLRVKSASVTTRVTKYQMHVRVQSGAPVAENEGGAGLPADNNTTANAYALPASQWVAGTLASADLADVYSVQANAGDTIAVMVDADPERDNVDTPLQAGIGLFGSGVSLTINDAGNTGPDGEAMFVTVKNTGTYFVTVSSPAGASTFGSYHLSVSVHPVATKGPNCVTYSNNTAVPISTVATGIYTSTITVPGNPRISDVDVAINLNHTNMPDLDVDLQAPGGNQVILFTDIGAAAEPDMDIVIDGDAAFPAGAFTVVSGLHASAETTQYMEWFDGIDGGGTWTLNVRDDTAAQGGTFNGWSLTICEQPPPCPPGGSPVFVAQTDFEADDGGFTHSGTQDEWERGLPTFAPITNCNSGTSCWKTDLDNQYNASADFNLLSPVVNLVGLPSPIYLRWAQRYQLESASFDFLEVDVQDGAGLNAKRLFDWKGATMISQSLGSPTVSITPSTGWNLHTEDISYLAGSAAQLKVRVKTDTSGQYGGVGIDDFAVYYCVFGACGDGIVDVGQQCDDGNLIDGDGCDSNCTFTGCNNGIQTVGEICDDGNSANGDGCDVNCTLSACGNGAKAPSEGCDDGNLVDDDGCDSNCTFTACGNSIVTSGEACDDGNLVSGDGCDANCTATGCPNGILTAGEACDDGNQVSGDGCDINCTFTTCGNGVTANAEQCDDGNFTSGDGCDANCTLTGCGNGITTAGEACDDLNQVNGDGCDNNCTISACGNGIVAGAEICDDGNAVNNDGCDVNCTTSACGNGVVAGTETCDDGNVVDGDGCDSNCTSTTCGNGIVTSGEACDDGNAVSGDGCDVNCTVTACGNGVTTGAEICDDGNLVDGDGCDSNCTMTACGNGVATSGEECDDGNAVEGDGCDSNCTATACGNAVLTDGEACDDGNLVDGDGCDSNCTDTACGNGISTDPEACDDGNLIDGDGCDSNCTVTECGNGVVTDGEVCDDGNAVDGDGCDTNCTETACGNGVVTDGEDCDDGNAVDGDGCDTNCTATACGNGVVTAPEACDDGNTDPGDGCDADCAVETTGEGGAGGGGGSGTGGTETAATTGSGGDKTSPAGGGCGCTVPSQDSSPSGAAFALAALGLAFARRRRAA